MHLSMPHQDKCVVGTQTLTKNSLWFVNRQLKGTHIQISNPSLDIHYAMLIIWRIFLETIFFFCQTKVDLYKIYYLYVIGGLRSKSK